MTNLTKSEKELLLLLLQQELDFDVKDEYPASFISKILVIMEKLKTTDND
jgi:hypothetical protein